MSWKDMLAVGVGALVGAFAFRAPTALPLLFLLPLCFAWAPGRWTPALVMAAYYVSANAALPRLIRQFFEGIGEPASAVAIYGAPLLLTVLLTLPFLLVRDFRPWPRARQAALAFALLTLPPIGLLGWQNPLFLAAWCFPGLGAFGLVATCALLGAVAAKPWDRATPQSLRRLVAVVGLIALGALTWQQRHPAAGGLAHWIATDTYFAPLPQPADRRGQQIAELANSWLAGGGVDVLILPESILPALPASDRMGLNPLDEWARRRGKTVVLGVTQREQGQAWRNTLYGLGRHGGTLQESRVAAPMGNWQLRGGVPVRPFASDLLTLSDRGGPRTVAVSLCYEDLLLWPHPGLLTHQSDALVSSNNLWMATGTSIPRVQATSGWALARMARVPRLAAVNRPAYALSAP